MQARRRHAGGAGGAPSRAGKVVPFRALEKLEGPILTRCRRWCDRACIDRAAVAATGRSISSSNPKLQNIHPQRSSAPGASGRVVARPGRVLVAADYSQIELRVLAHLSRRSGAPRRASHAIRTSTCAPPRRSSAWIRGPRSPASIARVAKAIDFRLVFGQTDFGLAVASRDRARGAPGVPRQLQHAPRGRRPLHGVAIAGRASAAGRSPPAGRVRPVPEEPPRRARTLRSYGERMARNTPNAGLGRRPGDQSGVDSARTSSAAEVDDAATSGSPSCCSPSMTSSSSRRPRLMDGAMDGGWPERWREH